MRIGRVKGWAEFQHYKDRAPPWIKLHRKLLDNFDYARLPIASKALAPLVWLLAAESQDGSVSVEPEWLAFRLRWTVADVCAGLIPLIQDGFIEADSNALAACLQLATPERETEAEGETETEREASPPAPSTPRKAEAQGSRLPADWTLPPDWLAWAKQERPDLDAAKEGAKFSDFWHGKAGKDARKADWRATWRNWIRNAKAGYAPPAPKTNRLPDL